MPQDSLYLINPGMAPSIYSGSEEYEENPRTRTKRRTRSVKRRGARKARRGHRAQKNRMPKRSRRGKIPKGFLKHPPRSWRTRPYHAAAEANPTYRYRRRKARKMSAEANPRKRRKASGRRRVRRSRSRAEANPRHKRGSRRVKRHSRNPGLPFVGGVWYKAPPLSAYRGNLIAGVGLGLLGVVDTQVVGMGVESMVRSFSGGKIPEAGVDAIRILGKIGGGSAISYMIGRFSGKTLYAQFHQAGVIVNVILDVIGTVIKYLVRGSAGIKMPAARASAKARTSGLDPVTLLGLGEISNAYGEFKLFEAVSLGHNLVVLRGNDGSYALGDPVAKEIVLRGDRKYVTAVVGDVMSARRKNASGFGEDYSIEQ